jgi:gluconokinase
MIVVIMGVAGAGKTTVGRLLAGRLHWPFVDADDLHSEANIAKMSRGEPLTDQDREPWLEAIERKLADLDSRGDSAVLACSALRRAFRDRLRQAGGDVRFVHLRAAEDVIAARLRAREAHFFRAGLLQSQFDALEEPDDALVVDAAPPPDAIVTRLLGALNELTSTE